MNINSISKFEPTLTIEKARYENENQYFERKSGRIKPQDLAKHISGFANANGGIIVLGIEDDGEVSGINEKQENDFRKVFINHLMITPTNNIEKATIEGQCILIFHIGISPDEIVCLKNGDAFLRIGDSTRKLTPAEFTALEYSRGIKSFESRIVEDATFEDLDVNLTEQYLNILGPTVGSKIDVFKARGLLKKKDGNWKLTVAAILLFGKCPTQFFPAARLRFIRYEGTKAGVGTSMNIIKDINIEKPLPLMIEEGRNLIGSQMREFQRLGREGKFVKVPEYPDFAWLEGLVNAITHRDYSINGDYIKIFMYDDRLEFHSPGKLPSIVTVENIQNTRFSRNPVIARVLSDFGWVRELNEGVKRIYVDMNNYFLEPPEFSEPNGNTVELVLRNNLATRSLRNIELIESKLKYNWKKLDLLDQQIIFIIANTENCTPSKLIALTKRARPTVGNHIKKLLLLDIIEEHSTSSKDPTKYFTIKL